MAEASLANIIDAADPADREDIAIRRLLDVALSDSGIELPKVMNGRSPLLNGCERSTPTRVSGIRSPLRRFAYRHSRGKAFGVRPALP